MLPRERRRSNEKLKKGNLFLPFRYTHIWSRYKCYGGAISFRNMDKNHLSLCQWFEYIIIIRTPLNDFTSRRRPLSLLEVQQQLNKKLRVILDIPRPRQRMEEKSNNLQAIRLSSVT